MITVFYSTNLILGTCKLSQMETRAALKHHIILSCLDQYMQTVKQSRSWSGLGITPKINRDLNKVILHLWSKFCDRVMSYHVDKRKAWNLILKWNLTFKIKANHPQKTIGTLTEVLCTFGPNLVILTWMSHKLSRRQTCDRLTHRRMDTQTQVITIPLGQNWPHIKITCREESFHNYP